MLFRKVPQYDRPITQIKPRRSKGLRIFLGTLFVLVLGVVGWIGTTGLIAFNNISAKNDSDAPSFFKFGNDFDPNALNEGDTRVNVLLIGIDNAAGLTDSIQVISFDPINNTMAMLSVPRDLYVTGADGKKSKINEVYNRAVEACVKKDSKCDRASAGGSSLKTVLRNSLGIPMHYFARVDFEGFKDVVDTVGGITIYVPTALSDPGYPCDSNAANACGYTQAAGSFKMNGSQALKYARCRNGNCGNDFGRSQRQQQIIEAIRQKALTLGVLSNPKKVTDLMTALGSHFKTDLKLDEMLKVFELTQKIDKSQTTTAVLDNSADGPLKSGSNGGGQYILLPKAGENNWSGVREFVLTVMPEPYLIKEAAKIIIVDASGKALATGLEKKLTALGYNVVDSETVNAVQATTTLWGDAQKKYTLALLKKRFSVTAITTKPTAVSTETADIILVVGSNYATK